MAIDATKREEVSDRFRTGHFPHFLGFVLEELDEGRCVMTCDVRPEYLQVHNILHGGVTAALADTALACAVFNVIDRSQQTTTIELKVNYLRPITTGRVLADARLIRRGGSIVVGEVDVYDSSHSLAAKALATFMIIEPSRQTRANSQLPADDTH